MKRIVSMVLVFVLVMTVQASVFANGNQSPEDLVKQRVEQSKESRLQLKSAPLSSEIAAEMQRIAEQYEVGEALSPEDADFIKKYAPINLRDVEEGETVQIQATETYYFEGYNNNGLIDAGLQGFFQLTKGAINHSLRTYMLSYDRDGKVRPRITNTNTFVGYGLIGSDGVIGKVVDFTQSNQCTNRSDCTMDKTTPFSGVMIYGYSAPVAQIYYSANTDENSVTISEITEWD